ncbi:MAG: PD40 domain-containing protein [Acidobacteriota bacterium]|nr:MAG: PD40 domain-containing protein [Acidobacteriota bacterium]
MESGGEPRELTALNTGAGEISHRLPFLLPDGQAVLYTTALEADSLGNAARVGALSLTTGQQVQLVDGWDGRYVPTGHLVFARDGNLRAIAFDPASLTTKGAEIPLLEDVTQSLFTVNPTLRTGGVQMSFSDSGLMVYLAGSVFPEIKNTVVWVDRDGREEPVGVEPRNFFTARASEDSKSILLTALYPPQDIWLYDTVRKTARRQTFEGNGIYAVWGPSPEGFTFSSDLLGPRSIFTKEIDSGPSKPTLMYDGSSSYLRPSAWSQDGRFLTFVEANPDQGFDIGYLSRDGAKKIYLGTRFSEQYPEISPNGKWMLFTTNESGRQEVYIRPFPGPGRTQQISTNGGYEPGWSPGGSEVYYRWREEFFSVRLRFDRGGNAVTVGEPEKLFEGDYGSSFAIRSYDLASNGRFLMFKRPDEATLNEAINTFFPDHIQVISNWFTEIQSKVPEQ